MISCERAWELLSQQLDEHLSPQETQELEEHLASCLSCRKDREELMQLDQALRGLGEVEAPADFTQRVMDQVRAEPQPRPKVIPLWRRPQVRALAGLAACALLCIGIYRVMPQQSDPSNGMIATSDLAPAKQPQVSDGSTSEEAEQSGQEPAQAPDDQETTPQPPVAQPRTADLPPVDNESQAQENSQAVQPAPEAAGSGSTQEEPQSKGAQVPYAVTSSVQTELVVAELSQQARALLPAQEEWSVDNQGSLSCTVSSQVLEQLCQVLDQEGTEYTVPPAPWTETCIVRLEP